MTAGPRLRDLRLSKRTSVRRRMVKLRRHDKGAKPIYWCGHCQKYSHNLQTHICGERQG